jgi:hypothetical protein
MNDWKEYQERLQHDMDRQVTSNKALLWTGLAVDTLLTFISLIVAIVALIQALMFGRDNIALQKEIAECKQQKNEAMIVAEKALARAEQNYCSEVKHAVELKSMIKSYHEQ